MDVVVARGGLDRSGAVIGSEVVAAGEAADVVDVTEYGRGDDGSDAVDLGQRRLGRSDGTGNAPFQVSVLLVDAVQIRNQIVGQLETRGGDRAVAGDVGENLNRLCS
jgi:hypothetical protein